jgi:hypothetical protein
VSGASAKRSGPPSEEERQKLRAAKEREKREATFERLREQTAGILDAIGASSLIVVDDQASPVTDYLAAFRADPRSVQDLVPAEDEIDPNDDRERWEAKMREVWDALTPDERRARRAQAGEVLHAIDPDRAPRSLEALERIFPNGRVTIIEPSEWQAQAEALTAGSHPPLVLFDQNLGAFEFSGLELLQAYRSSGARAGRLDPPAGILSAEVNERGELTSVDAKDLAVPPGSLVIVAKRQLDDGLYEDAVALFRLTANLPHLTRVRDRVLEGLQKDVEQASERVRALPARVLEDLVYRSSEVEGTWEGETMGRIAGLYLLDAARAREAVDAEMTEIIARARGLAKWVTDEDAESAPAARELHRIENFSDGRLVNKLRLPLANGDIFRLECEQDGKRVECFLVLVEQPCDLVVRRDGARKAGEAALLAIAPASKPKATLLEHPLPDAPPPPLPESGVVELKSEFKISLAVLDLCCMNSDGTALITDVDAEDAEPMLTEGLTLRARGLRGAAQRVLRVIGELEEDAEARGLLIEHQASGQAELDYDSSAPRTWKYPVTRVARLSRRQADALLVRYSAAQARAAFDHELTRFSD